MRRSVVGAIALLTALVGRAPVAGADPAPTTTVLTSAPTVVYGQPLTLTATVAPVAPGAGAPGGVVAFYDATAIVAIGVLSNGVATATLTGLSIGTHTLTATAAGGPNYASSTSSPVLVTVQPIPTTTVLSAPASAVVGQPVTLSASAAPVRPSTGVDNSLMAFYDGSNLLGWSVPVGGMATFTTRSLLVGSHTITAVSVGGPIVAGSTSGPITIAIGSCGCDWTAFRGGPSHPGVTTSETTLSPSNVGGLTPLWSDTVSGAVQSSPAVVGGIAYVGSANGSLYALNAATGAVVWHQPLGNQVHSSPALANGVVYVGCVDGTVRGFDALAGTPRWTATVGTMVISSPAVVNGIVYVGSRGAAPLGTSGAGYLSALDATTGATIWSQSLTGVVDSSPAVNYGEVTVGSQDGRVYAFDAVTGTKRWSTATAGGIASSPAMANGLVYVGSNDGRVWAFLATNGLPVWHVATGAVVASSPAVDGPTVYVANDLGTLYALNSINGATRWTASTSGPNHSSPVVADSVVYVGTYGSGLEAFDVGTGAPLWSFPSAYPFTSSPAVAGGTVYVGGWDGTIRGFSLPAQSASAPTTTTGHGALRTT